MNQRARAEQSKELSENARRSNNVDSAGRHEKIIFITSAHFSSSQRCRAEECRESGCERYANALKKSHFTSFFRVFAQRDEDESSSDTRGECELHLDKMKMILVKFSTYTAESTHGWDARSSMQTTQIFFRVKIRHFSMCFSFSPSHISVKVFHTHSSCSNLLSPPPLSA